MKKILLYILMLVPVLLISQTPVPPGPISGTWDQDGSPYMVNGEIYIEETDTLFIEPGVEVKFTGWYKFIVHGSLIAEGTDSDQILFTAEDTNKRWHSIRFMYATGTSVLDHCIIEYAQSKLGAISPDPDYAGGGVLCYYSPAASISILNSIIRNNIAYTGGGVQIIGTYPLIDNCEIIHNTANEGAGIDAFAMSSFSTAIIINSTIAYNHAQTSAGGIWAALNSNLEIKGNVIKYNIAGNGGGIKITSPINLIVSENIIAHNVCSTSGGGVLFCPANSDGTFRDNTIVFNHAGENGGGAYVTQNCSPTFESDILYFNTSSNSGHNQIHLHGTGGAPYFNYCDVQDGCSGFSGPGAPTFPCQTHFLNCIDTNPLFADPYNDDFSLTWENYPVDDNTKSPCIDNGKPSVFPEPDGTNNDIGPIYFFQQLDVPVIHQAGEISDTSFLAQWSSAYGALGYLLDVAADDSFIMYVLENQQVDNDTTYLVGELAPGQVYYYKVRSFNTNDTSNYSEIVEVATIATGIEAPEILNMNLFPNPCSGVLHLEYTIYNSKYTVFKLYSIEGVEVRMLLDEVQQPGEYELTFDISDLPYGLYFIRLQLGQRIEAMKLIKF